MRHRIHVPLLSDPTTYAESDARAAGDGRFVLLRIGRAEPALLYRPGEVVECSIRELPDGSKGLVATRSVSGDPEYRSRRTVYAVFGAFAGAIFGAALALSFDISFVAAVVGAAVGALIFAFCSVRWGDAAWEMLSRIVGGD